MGDPDDYDPNLSQEKFTAKRKEGPTVDPIRPSKRLLSDERETNAEGISVVSVRIEDEEQMEGGIDLDEMVEVNGDSFLNVRKIDFLFLERKISKAYQGNKNPWECKQLANEALKYLGEGKDEKGLHSLLPIDADLVKLLWENRSRIFCGVHLAKFDQSKLRISIENQLKETERYVDIVSYLRPKGVYLPKLSEDDKVRFLKGVRCILSDKSYKANRWGGCEEFVVAPMEPRVEKLVGVSELPAWAQVAFPGEKRTLRSVQSKIYERAFLGDDNLLLSFPTGLGDTSVNRGEYLVVYVTPRKSLVSRVVRDLSEKLQCLKVDVKELRGGDKLSLTRQIKDSQVLVTIPDNVHIITQMCESRLKVLIFNAIDTMDSFKLKTIVADTVQRVPAIRLVGLSATHPTNDLKAIFYEASGKLCRFNFNLSYCEVPLEQIYVGIGLRTAPDRFRLMNHVCYKRIILAKKRPILIFVHSRQDVIQTAREIRDFGATLEPLPFAKDAHIPTDTTDLDFDDLMSVGLTIHHDGMSVIDRNRAITSFSDVRSNVKVLISTAALAWAGSAIAHTVIIKGTKFLNGQSEDWTELGPSDVMQMLSCAKRPDLDSEPCKGIILTDPDRIPFYISLMNKNLGRIADICSAYDHLDLDEDTHKGTYHGKNVEALLFLSSEKDRIAGFKMPRHPNLLTVDVLDERLGFALVSNSAVPLSNYTPLLSPYIHYVNKGARAKEGYCLRDGYKVIFKDVLSAMRHIHNSQFCLVGDLDEENIKVIDGRAALYNLRLKAMKNMTDGDKILDYVKVADFLEKFVIKRSYPDDKGNFKLYTDLLRQGNAADWSGKFEDFETLIHNNVMLMTVPELISFYRDKIEGVGRRSKVVLNLMANDMKVTTTINSEGGWGHVFKRMYGSPLKKVFDHRYHKHDKKDGVAHMALLSFFRHVVVHIKDYPEGANMTDEEIIWSLEVQFPDFMFDVQRLVAIGRNPI